jgi:hypothetical protein
MARFNTKETFDHHLSYHLSGMSAPWCTFCFKSSLPSGEHKGGEVKGSGMLTPAELRTSGTYAGVRSNVNI